jgi:hypothetical protein
MGPSKKIGPEDDEKSRRGNTHIIIHKRRRMSLNDVNEWMNGQLHCLCLMDMDELDDLDLDAVIVKE